MKYEWMYISFDKEEYLTCIDYTIHIRIKFIVVDVYKSYRRKKKKNNYQTVCMPRGIFETTWTATSLGKSLYNEINP